MKSLVFHSLAKHTTCLEDAIETAVADRGASAGMVKPIAQDLEALLKLFESILYEEYTTQHKTLPAVGSDTSPTLATLSAGAMGVALTACNFACDFCGGDIFQSFFSCQTCAVPPEKSTTGTALDLQAVTLGDGLLICPSCYVDGRTCACETMQAAQCRPFALLLQVRNKAVMALRKVESTSSEYAI